MAKNFPESAIILDDDEVFLKTVGLYSKKSGLNKIDSFSETDSVWSTLRSEAYDLLMLDWQVPGKISGLALFNRIRRKTNFTFTPIMIISGFVHKDDFRILQEFPCTKLLEKPFTFKKFNENIRSLWQEYQWYQENIKNIDTIFHFVMSNPNSLINLSFPYFSVK